MQRRLGINDAFFDEINTEAKAYILGYITGDGCVTPRVFSISSKDVENLYHMRAEMQGKGGIGYAKETGVYTYQQNSPAICEKLISYGIGPNKTYLLEKVTAEIPPDLVHHFVRGYFDSDGSWTQEDVSCTVGGKRYHYIRMRAHIRGTISFLRFLRSLIPVTCSLQDCKYKALYISKKKDVAAFGLWLYQEATLFIPRKYKRFLQRHSECHAPRNRC